MITSLQAVVQGIVEGVTEFLPVSSTGHLIVSSRLIGMTGDKQLNDAFEIVIQLGAILAVVWFYRGELLEQARRVRSEPIVRRFWLNLFVAFFPVAVLGLALHKTIKAHLFSPYVVAASLIIGGLVLLFVDRKGHEDTRAPVGIYGLMPRHALAIGLAQIFSLIPGVSRSGASIVGGIMIGLDRETATKFSFFLAIPTLGSATLFELFQESHYILQSGSIMPFVLGTVVSFVVALLSIGWLLHYVSHHSFFKFGVYRIVAGIVVILFFLRQAS